MKRYDLNCETCNMDNKEDGDFVKYSDLNDIVLKLLKLEKINDYQGSYNYLPSKNEHGFCDISVDFNSLETLVRDIVFRGQQRGESTIILKMKRLLQIQ